MTDAQQAILKEVQVESEARLLQVNKLQRDAKIDLAISITALVIAIASLLIRILL